MALTRINVILLLTTFLQSVFADSSLSPEELYQKYEKLQNTTLERLVRLENRIDGLTDEFRAVLGDRKQKYPSDLKGPGKLLFDPKLIHVIISERKRLEKESKFQKELLQNPSLIRQYQKKLASDLLALETSSILITFTEYLDQYSRGERTLEKKVAEDPELLKVLAATHTALDYSHINKKNKAFTDPRVLGLLKPEDQKSLIQLLESGLGKMGEDPLPLSSSKVSASQRTEIDQVRFKKTRSLLNMLDQIAATLLIANKPYIDEYQYRILVLKQKMKERVPAQALEKK
ncbi:hypothetical protein EBR03_00745 [bacterium]|nr:hypothetical protein [bacterium]NBX82657.1 hypothetical protein [bacterium]